MQRRSPKHQRPRDGFLHRNKTELRRIPFLANLRNRSLQPFFDLEKNGQTFDQILFLNDVVFTLEDVLYFKIRMMAITQPHVPLILLMRQNTTTLSRYVTTKAKCP